jgi:RimJ/RimL family protein N-acetyltransferase
MELQPTLSGKLILTRPLTTDDFEALYRAASDPLIWELHPEPTRYLRPVFKKYFDSGIDSKGAFAVIDRMTGEIIGSSRYHDYDPIENTVEIGYTFLARAYWGGEYNSELKKLMLDHAFKWVDKVFFYVGEKNFRSQRALEKIGAVRIGSKVEDRGVSLIFELRKT